SAAGIRDEPRVREIADEPLAEAERRDLVLAAPEQERRLVDGPVLALDLTEALPAHGGERGGHGPRAVQGGVHVVDEALVHDRLVVEGEGDALVRTFLVPEAEERLTDAVR